MIPADDSRRTVELEDRFVILARFAAAARDYIRRGAKPVPEGFAYSSDTNASGSTRAGCDAARGGLA